MRLRRDIFLLDSDERSELRALLRENVRQGNRGTGNPTVLAKIYAKLHAADAPVRSDASLGHFRHIGDFAADVVEGAAYRMHQAAGLVDDEAHATELAAIGLGDRFARAVRNLPPLPERPAKSRPRGYRRVPVGVSR